MSDPEQQSPRRPRWRRWLRAMLLTGAGLLGMLGLLVMVLAAVVWIPGLSRFAVEQALTRWDASVPAQVEWSKVSGSLARGIRIDGLTIVDSEDHALVEAAELVLVLDLGALLHGEALVEGLVLRDLEIHVDHRWGDLANPDAEPSPPSPGYGPELPLRITATVEITRGRVLSDAGELISWTGLGLGATGEGRSAQATLALAGVELPPANLRVDRLELGAVWDEPRLTLELLEVDTVLGALRLSSPAWFDVSTLELALALVIDGDPQAIAERIELAALLPDARAPERIALELRGEGRLSDPRFDLSVELGSDGELHLGGFAHRESNTGAAELRMGLEGHLAAGLVDANQGELHVELAADGRRASANETIVAKLAVGLSDRRSGERVDVRADAKFASLEALAGEAAVTLRGAGIHLDGSGVFGDHPSGALSILIPDIGRPLGLVAGILATPQLAQLGGRLALSGSCRSASAGASESVLRCPAQLQLDSFEGFGAALASAHLDATLEPLREQPWIDAKLRGGGLLVADASLALTQFTARLVGTPAAFELRGFAEVGGRDLELADLSIGDVQLRASRGLEGSTDLAGLTPAFVALAATAQPPPRKDDLRVQLSVSGLASRSVELVASVPVTGLAIGRGPLDVRLAVSDFDLTALAPWMPATPSGWDPSGPIAAPAGQPLLVPQGRVDLDFALTGSVADPHAQLAVRGAHLELDRVDLGSLRLLASLDRDAAQLELEFQPGFMGGVELRARIPVTLELRHGRARWAREREHSASVELTGLDLARLRAELGPSIPALEAGLAAAELDGLLSASLRLAGPLTDPSINGRIRGLGLARRGAALGDLTLDFGYERERAELELRVEQSLATVMDARLAFALHLDPQAPTPLVIPTDAAIQGSVRIESLALASLAPLTGMVLDGHAKLGVEIDGSLAAPRASATLFLDQLATTRGLVGDVDLRVEFTPEQLAVELDLIRRGQHTLALAADLPLHTDLRGLAGGDAQLHWARDGAHRILLTGRGIDSELLSAFLDLPEDLVALASIDLHGGGQLSAFDLGAEVHGQIKQGDSSTLDVDGVLTANATDQQLTLALALTPEPDPGSKSTPAFDAELELSLPVVAFVDGDHAVGATPFKVRVSAPQLELDRLAGFLPGSLHDPQGVLEATFTGTGVLAAPRLEGMIAVHDSAISVLPLRQRFRNIEIELALTDDHIELSKLAMAAGKGSLVGSGQADIRAGQGLDAALAMEITKLPLVRPGLPAMIIDAGVDVALHSKPNDLSVAVALRKPKVRVGAATEAAPKSIPTSTSITFESGAITGPQLTLATADAETNINTSSDAGKLRLRLELVDPLLVTGNAVDMAWSGSVELDRDKGELLASGQLDTQRGHVDIVGAQFEILRGSVILPDDGSVDPYLDLVASTKAGDYEVTATVQGRVSRPTLTFSSNPGLDEYEIFSLLVTGSPMISDVEGGAIEAKAASLLAAVSSPQLQTKIASSLHIDRASLGFGDAIDQPILTVGKRVTRKVYVETSYHHNAPADENTAEVRVQYNFVPRWTLETYFGDAAVGGVGAYWSRSIGPSHWDITPAQREQRRRARKHERRGP